MRGMAMDNCRERQHEIHTFNPSICPTSPKLFFGYENKQVQDQYISGGVERPGVRMILPALFSSYQKTGATRK
jgi:hypothetical protein